MSLVVVGTVAFDGVETPFAKRDKITGGAAYYTSWAASFFTDSIRLVSIVGGDYPQEEIDAMKDRGIDTSGLEIKEDGLTFFWAGKYLDNMNERETLVTDLNVLDDFNPILPEHYKDSQYIMLGNLTPDVQMQVIDQLTTDPKIIALDTMNFWMDVAMDRLKEVIAKVDLLTINDEEARQLSGEYSLVKAAEVIHKMGPKYLVIKKGEHGALLFHENKIFFAPAVPLADVADPTGAGDSFAGGMMGYLAKTQDLSFENMKRAIIYGSAMASFCVEDFSIGKIKQLSEEDVNVRATIFKDLVGFSL